MTLTDVLLSRIVEDEGDARSLGGELRGASWQDGAGTPERVLAECEAKRRIISLHALMEHERTASLLSRVITPSVLVGMGAVLRILALPYADHPDYREEWRP